MRRFAHIILAVGLISVVTLSGCQKKVSVEAGERVVCQYGDVITDDVHMVQVPAKDAAAYTVVTTTGLCARHERLVKLYAEAQAALTAGDTKTAKTKLEQVVKSDPAFAQAAAQLEQIASGKNPKPDKSVSAGSGSSGSGSAPKPGGGQEPEVQPVGPTVTLQRWVPPTLEGYKAGAVGPDALALTRQYVGSGGDVEAITIAAEQFTSKQAAQAGLVQLMATYPADRSKEKVGGRDSVLGTGAKEYAAIGFTDGAIAIVVESHGNAGVTPKAMYDEIRKVAASLPTN